jgi:ribosomal protein S17
VSQEYNYEIGQKIVTRYKNPPVPKEKQYRIGDVVPIQETGTGKTLAMFEVTASDAEFIEGTITHINRARRAE